MLRLRCKARGGSQPLPGLTAHSRLRDMQATLAALTGVPAPAQRLLLGFPPRSLDLSDGERRLGDLGIHSGEGGGASAPRAWPSCCRDGPGSPLPSGQLCGAGEGGGRAVAEVSSEGTRQESAVTGCLGSPPGSMVSSHPRVPLNPSLS